MGESEGESRRGVLAALVILIVGAARFGEDILRALAKGRHPLKALVRTNNQSSNDKNNTQGIATEDLGTTPTSDMDSAPQFIFWDVDTEIAVDPGRYKYWDFDLREGASVGDTPILNYDILLRSGPDINVFMLEEDEFEAFSQGESFRYHSASETEAWRVNGKSQLKLAKYYIVIENPEQSTTSSESSDSSEATVSVKISFENGQ